MFKGGMEMKKWKEKLNSYSKTKRLIVLSLLALILGGCVGSMFNTKPDYSEEKLIREVLSLQFNGPDKKLVELMWNEDNRKVIDGVEVNPEFDKYFAEQYGDYFTESSLDTFVRTFGMAYPVHADSADYTTVLHGVQIEQTNGTENRYTFTADVGYRKANEEEKHVNVEGIVLISTDEHKIGKFDYTGDEGWSGQFPK